MPNYQDKKAIAAITSRMEELAPGWSGDIDGLMYAAGVREGHVHDIWEQAKARKQHGWRRIGGRKTSIRGECHRCKNTVILIDNPDNPAAPLYIEPLTIHEWP